VAVLVPNSSPIDWTSQPVKVDHLKFYAEYRKKAGGVEGNEASNIITELVSRQIGWVTFGYIAKGLDDKTATILKAAGAFVLDLYADLEAKT
jgi:hypothetical protein